MVDLLDFKANVFSQNGEDGVIEKIFEKIQTKDKICCEFGAWDGVHFCNVRNLIKKHGWYGVLIEGNPSKFDSIKKNYEPHEVCAINAFVDDGANSLDKLFLRCEKLNGKELDLLSVDIDGLDYLIFQSLTIRPKVICIEASAGLKPDSTDMIPKEIAKNNVGQSIGYFTAVAKQKGYSLVCYTGNAFFVRNDLLEAAGLSEISPELAFRNFLKHFPREGKEWLYLANLGKVEPFYTYNNSLLTKEYLGFTDADVKRIERKYTTFLGRLVTKVKAKLR